MKRTKLSGLLLGLSVCSLCPTAAVAAGGDSISLSLDRVVEIALSDNPSVKVADQDIEIQKYAKKEAITGLFPTITVSGTASDAVVQQKMKLSFSPEPITMGQQYTYALNGTAAVPLVAPQLWKSIEVSEEQVKLSLEAARASKVEAVSQAKNAYFSLLLSRDAVEALEASYKTAEQNAAETTKKYELGTVSEYDKLTAEVQLAALKPQLLNYKNNVKLAEMQLKVILGMDVDEPVKFTGRLSDFEQTLFDDLMKLKADTSLADNPQLRQMDVQRRQLVLAEKINRLGYIPTLALSFTSGYQAFASEFNPFDAQYFGNATLALSLSWTLFDGGSKYMKSKQNRLQLENLDLQRENVQRQLELAIQSALNGIETAAEEVVSNKENVYTALRAYQISEKRYDVGSGTMLELNNSETRLLNARLQYSQSIYNYLSSKAQLIATLGHLVTDK